jgi:hypothetical protein
MALQGVEIDLNLDSFTQEKPDEPEDNWQVPYGELAFFQRSKFNKHLPFLPLSWKFSAQVTGRRSTIMNTD